MEFVSTCLHTYNQHCSCTSHYSPLSPCFTAAFSPASKYELFKALDDCLKMAPAGCSCRPSEHGPIADWDVSNVTDMMVIFSRATCFNADLSNWDVSRVTEMRAMFYEARAFDADLSNWDVSRVTGMKSMFFKATSFNSDVSKWDVSRVTDMWGMFRYASAFNQTLCGKAWVNSKADKTYMFRGSSGSISTTVCGMCPIGIIFAQ